MWVKNVILQNYESKKCCFKKSEREEGKLKMGKLKEWEWKMGQKILG